MAEKTDQRGPGEQPGHTDPEEQGGPQPGHVDPEEQGGSQPGHVDPGEQGGSQPGRVDPGEQGGSQPGRVDPGEQGGSQPGLDPQEQGLEESESVCPGCQAAGALVLPCGHRLCQVCVELCQRELGGQGGCTVCYGRNLLDCVLNRLLDSLFQGQSRRPGRGGRSGEAGGQCPEHGEMFSMFCMEEEELVCSECQREEHEEHECCSVEDAALDCKRELQSSLRPLQSKLDSLNTALHTSQAIAQHIKNQSEHAERVVGEEFEKLHHFLRDEEAALMSSIKEEEEEKSRKMKERMERIMDDIACLTDAIRETEEAMAVEDVIFLKNFKKTSERTQLSVEEPEVVSGSLLDLAQHLGCIRYHAWENMQNLVHYTPVTLDPNTADACLSVSDNLISVRYSEEEEEGRHLPDNRERFRYHECVLGSEAYSSGSHKWEVEVGENSCWALGVAQDNFPRKEWFPPDPEKGLWVVCFTGGQYRACSPTGTPLTLKKKTQRVRVHLDWERARLTFSDASDNSIIYSFKHRFTRRVFPYLSTSCRRHPLTISAGRVSVSAE
ncbi:E3 ubiquitin-protein ligase TRIM39 [Hypomesus transpacificus]|uniref:E3 ubiquitin-protein ligase TRIM39 n=1 Tax=Hypomesus transpacificus TaxID=137520 RepID=UPI001F080735|nr:E3 ubiquitin-protein ligase TRIM39 [Hypomesus transpacificus]